MDQNIKAVAELEKLVNEATSQTLLKADLNRLKRISEIINSRSTMPKPFVNLIKTKLASAKHPKSQLLTLELIEYTTCKCGQTLHNEYNSKSFLQIINSIFNQRNLADEVKDKALWLIQFWERFFDSKRDVLGNFGWYYNNINKRGIPFPPFKNSIYYDPNSVAKAPQGGNQHQANDYGPTMAQPVVGMNFMDHMDEREKKLYRDLNVVLDNIKVANSMIDEKDMSAIDDVMINIKSMEKKLLALPDKLSHAQEDFLYKFCMAIIEDIGVTIDRHYRLVSKLSIPKFVSKSDQVVEDAKNKPVDVPNLPSFPDYKTNNDEVGFGGFDVPVNRQPQQQDPFSQVQNNYYNQPPQNNNNNLLIDTSDPFGGNNNMNYNQPYGNQQGYGFNAPTSPHRPVSPNQGFGFGGPMQSQQQQRSTSPNAFGGNQWGGMNQQSKPQGGFGGFDIDFTQQNQPPVNNQFNNQYGYGNPQAQPFGMQPAQSFPQQRSFSPNNPYGNNNFNQQAYGFGQPANQ
jgi:hypothetical protein